VRDDLHKKLANFLDKNPTPQQLDYLWRLITIVPEHEPAKPLVTIEEGEERYALMREVAVFWKNHFLIVTKYPKKRYQLLSQIVIATMMTMDLTALRCIRNDVFGDQVLKILLDMPCFIKAGKYFQLYLKGKFFSY